MERLTNTVQPYAWGSRTAIPQLLGLPPSEQPQAELWLGAHPLAPSRTAAGESLEAVLARAPERLLGAASVERFGPRLPFLLKVLAAAQPLSLQAHPSLDQARQGFAAEQAAGVPLTAPHRNYKDSNHKPELICALTRFEALCGFRRVADSVRLLRALGADVASLERDGLTAYFGQLLRTPRAQQAALVAPVVEAARRYQGDEFRAEAALALRLAAQYPGDAGLLGALLLNLVVLSPGQALYLGAGNLHAYLEGTGVELMASSDNVLRGGLTPKHVDVAELLRVLDFGDGPPEVLEARGAPEAVFPTPAPDFRLSRVTLDGRCTLPARGPQVLLVTQGRCTVSARGARQQLAQGESLFVGADEGALELEGAATVFRATHGL